METYKKSLSRWSHDSYTFEYKATQDLPHHRRSIHISYKVHICKLITCRQWQEAPNEQWYTQHTSSSSSPSTSASEWPTPSTLPESPTTPSSSPTTTSRSAAANATPPTTPKRSTLGKQVHILRLQVVINTVCVWNISQSINQRQSLSSLEFMKVISCSNAGGKCAL